MAAVRLLSPAVAMLQSKLDRSELFFIAKQNSCSPLCSISLRPSTSITFSPNCSSRLSTVQR